MSDLTPHQVAHWLRKRAQRWIEMANEIEAISPGIKTKLAAKVDFHESNNGVSLFVSGPRTGDVNLTTLAESVRRKSGRVKELASRFNVEESRIRELIDQSDGQIQVVERGWLKIKQ